jgi:antitoxin (DNA-binding transcriptional repressor) of toxin-antitoxin stability system
MIRIELSTYQRDTLKGALQHVANGQQIILTADGIELAAMIPMGDLDLLQEVEDALDSELIDGARAEMVSSGEKTITLEELRKELDL